MSPITRADEPPADTTKVEKVTVTAQKRKQNAQDVPATVNALTAKNLKDLGINTSDKLAEFTPGLTIAMPSGQGNQPIVAIRGVGNNDFNTNNAGPNGIYADEVYLSAPSSQTFLAFDLDRVEVLKGPQGTLYGRNTSGGAVNFISNKPLYDDFGAGASASYSTYNTWNLEGFVNVPTGDRSAARVAGIWNTSDGYMRNLLDGDRVSGTDGYALRGQWKAEPTDNLQILLNLHGSHVDTLPQEYHQKGALSFNGTTFDPCTKAQVDSGACTDLFFYSGPANVYQGNYDRTQHLKNKSVGGSARIDYDLGGVTLTSISALESNDKFHPEDSDSSPNNLLQLDFGVESSTFTQEFRAAGGGDKLNWLVGAYYLGETLKQDQGIDLFHDLDLIYGVGAGECPAIINVDLQFCAQRGTSHSRQKTNAYALFGQTDFEILPATRLTLGGRYTSESRDFSLNGSIVGQSGGFGSFGAPQQLWNGGFVESIDESAFSWRVALDHHITDKVMAYASFATGFKSGGFNGGFLDVNVANATAQVAPVRPEKNNAYEIGLKADLLGDTLRFNVAGFYYDYKDLQLHTLVNAAGGVPTDVLDNAQKATIKGIDLEAVSKPVDNLTLRLTAEWLDATLDKFTSARSGGSAVDFSGNTLPNAPKFSLTGIAEYTIPLGNGDAIDLVGSASYRSKVFFDPSNDPLIEQDHYWLLDARVAYTIDDGQWQVAAFGRNLGNQKYNNMAFDLQSSFGLIQEIVAPPRTFGIEASFRY